MYNLLVNFLPWEGGTGTVKIDRLFENTEENIEKHFKNGDSILWDELTKYPCLFMQEGMKDQLAHVGTITRARPSKSEVLIDYVFEPNVDPISNKLIFLNKADFDIQKNFEFGRTHWAVKDIDLYRTFLRLSSSLCRTPKVFSINKTEFVDRTLISVMMPFDTAFNLVYEAIKDAAIDVGMSCQRADEIWEKSEIIQDIVTLIDKSLVVVCDCTGRNANVFYEIGIAHTLGREVILITQSEANIPFDLRHLHYVKYLDNEEGRQSLKRELVDRLKYLKIKI